jgi:hypothetical protein
VIQSIFYLLDLRVFFCFLFRRFILFLPPVDGNLFIGWAGAEVADGSTGTATGISSWPEVENGLRDFILSMAPEREGRLLSGTATGISSWREGENGLSDCIFSIVSENTDDCDSGVGGNITSSVVSAIVAYVKTNEVTPMKTYDNIGMWSVFILKL